MLGVVFFEPQHHGSELSLYEPQPDSKEQMQAALLPHAQMPCSQMHKPPCPLRFLAENNCSHIMCGGIILGTLAPSQQKNFIAETGSDIIPLIFARAKNYPVWTEEIIPLVLLRQNNYPAP